MKENQENYENNLKYAFDYIKTFYREVAQMMNDIIDEMKENGWEPGIEYITDEMSYSLEKPKRWLSYYIYKNFQNNQVSNYYKGVLICFDEEKSDFPPSVICGNILVQKEFYHKDFLFWLWDNNLEKLIKRDGKILDLVYNYKNNDIKGKFFSIPLASISNKNKLDELVIKKLLNL